MNYLQDLGKFLISTSVFGGLIVWLLKTYFEKQLKNDIEKHKAEMELLVFKQKTQFSKLHEEVAEAIKKLYALLSFYSSAVNHEIFLLENNYDTDFKQIGEQIDKILSAGIEVDHFYNENKILLKEDICDKVERLKAVLLGSTKKVMISQIIRNNLNENNKIQLKDTLNELKELMANELPPLKSELEQEFRNMLGVTTYA